jgi:EmrB/QacA subfamily drug resistance transporter
MWDYSDLGKSLYSILREEPPMTTATTGRGIAMGILIVAGFMDLLDVTIVQIALTDIRDDLGATPSQLEWVVSGYMLAFAVLLVTGGRLGDARGRRFAFLVGVAGFTVASAVSAAAASGDMLVASRVVQGGFAALMVPQALSTLQALYSPKERAPMLGILGAVSGLSAVVAPLLGGWLITADVAGLGWRTIFLLNIPVGVALFALALRFVPDTRSSRCLRLDPLGVVLLTLALLGLVYPLVEGRALDWPAWLWAVAAAGAALFVVFVRLQRSTPDPLLPLRLFGNRGFAAGVVTQAAFQGAMNAFTVVFFIYVQSSLGFTAQGAGLTILPFSLGAFVGVGVAVPLGAKVGKLIVTAGALVQAGALGWAITVLVARGAQLSGWDLAPAFALMGAGLGLLVVPLVDMALAAVPETDAGAASGLYSTFQQVGAALGVAVAGTVFFSAVGTDWSQPSVLDAVVQAGWVAIGGYLLSAAASLLLPGREVVQARAAEEARALKQA